MTTALGESALIGSGGEAQLPTASLIRGWSAGQRNDLIDRALPGRLVGPKAEQLGSMAEPVARHVVVPDLDDQLRLQRALIREPPLSARSACRSTAAGTLGSKPDVARAASA